MTEGRAEMERLTKKAFKPSVNSQYVKKKGFYTADCIERLGVYEDTGLTPPEIIELKERDKPRKIKINAGVPTCPVCGRRIVKCYDFCPDCGQRLEQ